MPLPTGILEISRTDMFTISSEILKSVGAPNVQAHQVADSLIQAQEAGHASHGVIRLIEYTNNVKSGVIVADAQPKIISDLKATAVIDGSWGWGQVACKLAVEVTEKKAREFGVSTTTIRSCNHIGRLGEYVETLASKSLVALMWCNGDSCVAAFGGKERIFGTNPFAAGIPTDAQPLVIDFATAATAEGKLRVARAKKEKIEPGLIVDKNGNPSSDPEDFYAGGSLLPFGGHKGYGLLLMIELLGGALSGNHPSMNSDFQAGNGAVLICIDPSKFVPYNAFLGDITESLAHIKQTPPVNADYPVLIPGEVENNFRELNRNGIQIHETIWNSIISLHRELIPRK